MIAAGLAFLTSSAGRWGAVALIGFSLFAAWQYERAAASRAEARARDATAKLATAQQDLSNRRKRDEVESEVDRLPGADAERELRREWERTP